MANIPDLTRAIGNKLNTTLSSGIDENDLTFSVTSGSGFLAAGGYIIMDKGETNEEIMYIESVTGSSFTVATNGRGVEGTVAVSHIAGASVQDVIVANHVNGHVAAVTAVDSDVTTLEGRLDAMKNSLASAYRSGNQSIGISSATLIQLNAETYDIGNNFASNQYTAPVTGYYHVIGQIYWAGTANNAPVLTQIRVNGNNVRESRQTGVGDQVANVSDIIPLAAGDTVSLYGFNADSSSRNAVGGASSTFMTIQLVGY